MSFTKQMLVTGDLIKMGDVGDSYVRVFLNTKNGDIVSGSTWFPLGEYSDEKLFDNRDSLFTEVWRPKYNADFKECTPNLSTHTLIWRKDPFTKEREELTNLDAAISGLIARKRELIGIINRG